jgi:hypothetical protein
MIVVFASWYGTGRVIEDFLREDVRHFGLTGSQITSTITILLCLAWLAFVRRPPRWGHWGDLPRAEVEEPPPTMAAQPQDREER